MPKYRLLGPISLSIGHIGRTASAVARTSRSFLATWIPPICRVADLRPHVKLRPWDHNRIGALPLSASWSVELPVPNHLRSVARYLNKPSLAEGAMLDHHSPATNLRKKAHIKPRTEISRRQKTLDIFGASLKEDNKFSSHRHSVSTDQLN